MMKKFAFLFLLILPLAACGTTNRAPEVSQAQADLHAAEKVFAATQKSILSLARNGAIKGEALKKVKKAELVAYEALRIARAAVDAKQVNAGDLVAAALLKIVELTTLFGVK